MSPRPTWLHTRSTELQAALLDLGLTITDTEARTILDDKITEYATLMRVTRQTAQRDFTDERLLAFAQSLALSLSDEAPGADLIEFERTISMPVAAVGLTTAALAEALKVAHINLDDKEAVAGLSLLSTLGMITESPWVRWRLLALETRMEACRMNGCQGGRRCGGIRRRRRPVRCGWSGRCGPSWGPSMGRQRGLPRSWVTGSSPSGRGSSRPISMTV